MKLVDFLPKYPDMTDQLDFYTQPFADVISSKKEFVDLKLPHVEDIPDRPGKMLLHQTMISRFLSSNTPYDELLLYHEMGTGKTCTAVACIEQLRQEKNNISGAFVFARGKGLLKNFIDELLFKCTDGRYIPDNFPTLTPSERVRRVKKKTGDFYTFETFERFAKFLKPMTDEQIRTAYSNNVIVIDEVHNIRLTTDKTEDELDIYDQFKRFLHLIENRKILLMSGTPMKDQPSEIANVMNLILPEDKQFDPDSFVNEYFEDDKTTMKPSMTRQFSRIIAGRVSYLKSMTSAVKKVFKGSKIGELKHFVVWPTYMSDFQTLHYNTAYSNDHLEKSIWSNSRQASLFVFPDGTYGSDGFSNNVQTKTVKSAKNTDKTVYSLSDELVRQIGNSVDGLRKFSCKYADLIENILSNNDKTFVYSEFVRGSGAILLGLILQEFGYTMANGYENQPGKRYSIVTNQTSSPVEIKRSIDQFNSIGNSAGAIVSVIVGSRVISEGYTLKGVTAEVILTPHWNYSETAQAIARGWRVGSHSLTPDVTELSIYQTAAIPIDRPSIDMRMYHVSEQKDMQIKAIERAIKISAFDCYLNRDRNLTEGYDGMRECDYSTCDYECDARPLDQEDTVTFDAYYATESEAITTFLRDHFQSHVAISFDDLKRRFSDCTTIQVWKTIRKHIEANTIFLDRNRLQNYLRMDKNTVFISMDPSIYSDYYTSFYTRRIAVDTDVTFQSIVKDRVFRDIKNKLDQIFRFPKYVNVIVPALPIELQTDLLKGSIMAASVDSRKNVETRDAVLAYFKGSYVKDDKQWILTMVTPPLCLKKGEKEWKPCAESEIPKIKESLLKSPIGYYGMNNPKMKDMFCIKEIQSAMSDLRKVKVGRRCEDYEKRILVDLAARRIPLSPPPRTYATKTREELLSELDRNHSEVLKQEDRLASDDALKRLIYWNYQSRPVICANIRDWMQANNLVEENENCGVQTKRRTST